MRNELLSDYHPDFRFNYCSDGLAVFKNIGFYTDSEFRRGYDRWIQAAGQDWGTGWRFHTCLWAARNAMRIEGDFVECGVGKGCTSSGIMEVLDWNAHDRQFYLFDTWTGIAEELCSEEEKRAFVHQGGVAGHNELYIDGGIYAESYESVRDTFTEWTNVTLVKGAIPYSLSDVSIDKVAFLHIDMNAVTPEIAALEFFWPTLSTGACVILDDYAFPGHELQYMALNDWGRENNVSILTIPTGQGLIIKA